MRQHHTFRLCDPSPQNSRQRKPTEMAKRSRSSRSPSRDPSSESRSRRSSLESSLSAQVPSKIHLPDTSRLVVAEVMRCSLPPHRETLSFSSYEDYEIHYRQAHVNRCTECGRNFPTDQFLNLHIEENHDPLVAARRARGEKTVGSHASLSPFAAKFFLFFC